MSDRQITQLLVAWKRGEAGALEALMPLVYDELRRMAGRAMRSTPAGATLQPTAIVHEALIRLIDAEIAWHDRHHFLALMAQTMRRVLIDYARGRFSEKRGGGELRVTLHEDLAEAAASEDSLLDLDRSLTELARLDARKAAALEMCYFGGFDYRQIAAALSVSEATVDRELRFAKSWLARRLACDQRATTCAKDSGDGS